MHREVKAEVRLTMKLEQSSDGALKLNYTYIYRIFEIADAYGFDPGGWQRFRTEQCIHEGTDPVGGWAGQAWIGHLTKDQAREFGQILLDYVANPCPARVYLRYCVFQPDYAVRVRMMLWLESERSLELAARIGQMALQGGLKFLGGTGTTEVVVADT